ncbi:2-oxoacid:acceptor oxidoreductase subunit alpha [Pontiella sulfatireligans]|uniref:2-oxoglutarate oxidoreductase subunit KorA n=1 Tax=Pontiella sulfatireligans TaxID=2750658 RepID=A0A6C2UMW2_9BACT|nr:2-oxoacid:acceptor oxidoreductase subunit alpha [Pontiella sulfatireligans]VGO21610.1 2-oxoglutarate oxidoreductase subunit KorA [Pontiella sulfatireligans]
MAEKKSNLIEKDSVVVRFAGDSGDGMQTVGELFADASALLGDAIVTFPDFPSEIRAPAGSLPGVSGFQVHFGCTSVMTPGDKADALIVMNPAALKVNLRELEPKGLLIVNTGSFTAPNLKKALYETNPLDDPALEDEYTVFKVDINALTAEALKDLPLKPALRARCKNFFSLGIAYWVYSRPLDMTLEWIETKWREKLPMMADANTLALKAGFIVGENKDISLPQYSVHKRILEDGIYRKITGNEATALGLIAASENSWRDLVLGSYPITPATPILETLSKHRNFNVKTVQAEDEIAAIGVAIGAAFAGALGVTTTSGPGLCLKSEALGLAVITELPLVVVNVQRAGPSTGLPTKTEQADLLQTLYGRNGESPVAVIAADSPSDCFDCAIEAARIALKFRTPVVMLTDTYLANGSEPWKVPEVTDIPDISVEPIKQGEAYIPYQRDPKTLARRLAVPGRPGFEHRIGGLEKTENGVVSYDAENHETMCRLRAEKVQRIADDIPPLHVMGDPNGKVLVVGWGSTRGAITMAVERLQADGEFVAYVHLRHLNPLPKDLGELMKQFDHVVVPELNLGQLSLVLRAEYLVDVKSISKVQGRMFLISELVAGIKEYL